MFYFIVVCCLHGVINDNDDDYTMLQNSDSTDGIMILFQSVYMYHKLFYSLHEFLDAVLISGNDVISCHFGCIDNVGLFIGSETEESSAMFLGRKS